MSLVSSHVRTYASMPPSLEACMYTSAFSSLFKCMFDLNVAIDPRFTFKSLEVVARRLLQTEECYSYALSDMP